MLEAVITYALDDEAEIRLTDEIQQAFFDLIKPTLDSGRKRASAGKQGGSKTQANEKQNASEGEIEGEREEE